MVDKSKQGIEMGEEYVYKKHNSLAKANLEKHIASIYSNNHLLDIRIPEYGDPFMKDENIYLPIEKINGKSLMGNKDSSLKSLLVRDLALFHTMFAQKSKVDNPNVIYRDAINSNYLIDGENIIHIDFSSSNKFVHCFDDLALLIHPLWSKSTEKERKKLINEYLEYRSKFNNSNLSNIEKISIKQISNHTSEEKKENYRELISNMELEGMNVGNLTKEINNINFEKLIIDDYDFFFKFRTLRGEFYLQKVWGDSNEN